MKTVFVLVAWHLFESWYGCNDILGIFETEEEARKALEACNKKVELDDDESGYEIHEIPFGKMLPGWEANADRRH